MKRFVFIIFVSFFHFSIALTQNTKYSIRKQYYYKDYTKAEVFTKTNSRTEVKLNYNVLLDEMDYLENGRKLSIRNVEDIVLVRFKDQNFIVHNQGYYKLIYADKSKVYSKLVPKLSVLTKPPEGAYGTSNETSSVSKMSSIEQRKDYYRILLAESSGSPDIEIPVQERFYFLKEDKLLPLTKNTLYKAFEGKKATIKAFIKKNKISLRKSGDIEKLFTYCDSL